MQVSVNPHKISLSQSMSLVAGGDEEPPMPRVRDGPKCAYELLTLGALSFPSNAATPHFPCLETICKYETEKRRKSGDWRICFVFALYLHYRLRNDSLIRSVVHVFIVITRRLWHS